jgi:NAD(P)-dependent dehydrogenase (short-subunit alcohol dehydrogenase family)
MRKPRQGLYRERLQSDHMGFAGHTAYTAAKSASVSFTRTWSLELARSGVTGR